MPVHPSLHPSVYYSNANISIYPLNLPIPLLFIHFSIHPCISANSLCLSHLFSLFLCSDRGRKWWMNSLCMFLSCAWRRKENVTEILLFGRQLKATHSKWNTTGMHLHRHRRKPGEKKHFLIFLSFPLITLTLTVSLLLLVQWIQSLGRLTASR